MKHEIAINHVLSRRALAVFDRAARRSTRAFVVATLLTLGAPFAFAQDDIPLLEDDAAAEEAPDAQPAFSSMGPADQPTEGARGAQPQRPGRGAPGGAPNGGPGTGPGGRAQFNQPNSAPGGAGQGAAAGQGSASSSTGASQSSAASKASANVAGVQLKKYFQPAKRNAQIDGDDLPLERVLNGVYAPSERRRRLLAYWDLSGRYAYHNLCVVYQDYVAQCVGKLLQQYNQQLPDDVKTLASSTLNNANQLKESSRIDFSQGQYDFDAAFSTPAGRRAAELRALGSQYKTATQFGGQTIALYVPITHPATEPYQTHYAELAATRRMSAETTRLNTLLPILYETMQSRSNQASAEFSLFLAAFKAQQSDASALFAACDRFFRAEKEAIYSAVRYNSGIAVYSCNTVPGNISGAALLRTLNLRPTQSVSGATSAVFPTYAAPIYAFGILPGLPSDGTDETHALPYAAPGFANVQYQNPYSVRYARTILPGLDPESASYDAAANENLLAVAGALGPDPLQDVDRSVDAAIAQNLESTLGDPSKASLSLVGYETTQTQSLPDAANTLDNAAQLMPLASASAQDDAQKAEEERLAAEAAKKAEEEKKAAEEAAKKAEEKAAAEAAKKAEEEKAAAEAAKKAEEEKKAAEEAAKKAEEEKKAADEAAKKAEEEKAAAEAAKKAEEEKKAEEDAAKKAAEEEAKKLEEAKKADEERKAKEAEEEAKKAAEEPTTVAMGQPSEAFARPVGYASDHANNANSFNGPFIITGYEQLNNPPAWARPVEVPIAAPVPGTDDGARWEAFDAEIAGFFARLTSEAFDEDDIDESNGDAQDGVVIRSQVPAPQTQPASSYDQQKQAAAAAANQPAPDYKRFEQVVGLYFAKSKPESNAETGVAERPASLNDVVARAYATPDARFALVKTYWELQGAAAAYHIEELVYSRYLNAFRETQDDYIKTQAFGAQARYNDAKGKLRDLQLKTLALMNTSPGYGYPTPITIPFCGKEFNLGSPARFNAHMTRSASLISERLRAAQEASAALNTPQITLALDVKNAQNPQNAAAALEKQREIALAFVKQVVELNIAIAEYVAYFPANVSNEQFVKALSVKDAQ